MPAYTTRFPAATRHSLLPLLGALAALVLIGCGDSAGDTDGGSDTGPRDSEPADRPDIGPPPETGLELGTGVSAFEPLPEEDGTLEIFVGSQGGFHVFAAVRFSDTLEPENALLSYTLTDTSTDESLILPKEVLLSERRLLTEPGAWIRLGDRLIFEASDPSTATGVEVEVTATLETEAGETVSDSRVVTIVDEE